MGTHCIPSLLMTLSVITASDHRLGKDYKLTTIRSFELVTVAQALCSSSGVLPRLSGAILSGDYREFFRLLQSTGAFLTDLEELCIWSS